MWDDLLRALALLLVFEGILPFLSPRRLRQSLLQIASLEDRVIRILGLACILLGAGALQWINWAG
jgi:uncharacterized protein YjeT (DUF2065 family)